MIPFLLLAALGLGAALTAYEFSPKIHERVDAFAHAFRAASAAHRDADARLANAGRASTVAAAQHAQAARHVAQTLSKTLALPPTMPPPVPRPSPVVDAHVNAGQSATDAAVEHVADATTANKAAAGSTADMAKNAKTEAEKQAAAQSAVKVVAREKKIADALAKLGEGECGARSYARVTPQVRDTILAKLHAEGMTVTGNNPWNIDTGMGGVRLRAVWDPAVQQLKLIVTDKWGLVGCDTVWNKVEPKLREVIR